MLGPPRSQEHGHSSTTMAGTGSMEAHPRDAMGRATS